MEQRLSIVTLAARDIASLASFYERLGWSAGFRNDEVAFFQMNGLVLALWRRDAFARELGVMPETLAPGGTALGHNVRAREDVDAALERARGAGATIRAPARDAEWGGRSGHFADPEGFLWEVAVEPGVAHLGARRDAHGVTREPSAHAPAAWRPRRAPADAA